MSHYTQGFLPILFNGTWPNNAERQLGVNPNHMLLRNRDHLDIPFARTLCTERHPLTAFPTIWENFDDNSIKIIRNKLEFKKKLKEFFLNKLSSTVTCNKLYCPACSRNIH